MSEVGLALLNVKFQAMSIILGNFSTFGQPLTERAALHVFFFYFY